MMQFKGDIEGSFILIFPKGIATITMETLLNEKIDTNDYDTLKDGVGEFCNIIMGSIKTAFSKINMSITFALPKTYISLKSVQGVLGNENGIWVNMLLSEMPFYIFISKRATTAIS